MHITVIKFDRNKFRERILLVLLVVIVLTATFISSLSSAYVDGHFTPVGAENEKKTVIIDAGHGGEDCGAIGHNGVYEKNLNMDIAFLIGEELSKNGYEVIYTRTEDKLLYKPEENIKGLRKISDLKNRCAIANENPDALFISIHMNTFGASKYSGLQVYYSDNNEESEKLAEKIQYKVKEDIQPTNKRKVKVGKDIYILENVSNPAVLIECGFLSNPEECEKLSDKEYQKQLSFSIVCAIIDM